MRAIVRGMWLGTETTPYSFDDENEPGRKVTGETVKASVLQGKQTVEVKVKPAQLGLVAGLSEFDEVEVLVDVQAQKGARGAYLTTTFVEFIERPASAGLALASSGD